MIGFTIFPLMPPRLLNDAGLHLGFVDTLQRYPTFWSFDSGPAAKVSNQYAAMPSVHIAWSTWCALALVPRMKTLPRKILAACYPVMTLIVIVITANHYVIDAAGGLLILSIGWVDRQQAHPRGARSEDGRRDSPIRTARTPRYEPRTSTTHDVVHGLVGERELHAARGDEREATGRHARDAQVRTCG